MMKRIIITILIVFTGLLFSSCGNLMNDMLAEINNNEIIVLYGITYDANGADSGSVPVDGIEYAEGDSVTVSGNSGELALEGYFFTGWNTQTDGLGTGYKEDDTFSMGTTDITLYAQWVSPSKIIASDRADDDEFGYSVAISGDYAIIGAYLDDDGAADSGSAYIYYRTGINTWEMEEKLTASDAAAGDYFGYAVAISGDYAIVGAYQDDDNAVSSGSAYIYHRSGTNTWGDEAKLVIALPDAEASDYFGWSVAVSGDYAIIGAFSDEENGANAGAAYIYHRTDTNTWDGGVKILASDGAAGDEFGYSVAISGDYAVIGARKDDDTDADAGGVYVYHRTGTNAWDSGTKLTASDGAASDYFGHTVSVSGDYIIVGAYFDDDGGDASGSSYIYHRTGTNSWDDETKLTASDGAASDYFGFSVSISGDYAFIGAYLDDDNFSNSGSSYIFHRSGTNTWFEETKLTASDGANGDYYGYSVAVSGDYGIIGAYGEGNIGTDIGSAWIIQFR